MKNVPACLLVLILSCGLTLVFADTPANCTFEEIRGDWIFYETERNQGADIDCDNMGIPIHKKRISLKYPNLAVDNYGNKGTWTMVYNEGFEVRVTGRSYFAFSFYNQTGKEVTSYCDSTLNGWSRDLTLRNWACFKAKKTESVPPKINFVNEMKNLEKIYKNDLDFVGAINKAQSSWTAKEYAHHETMTLKDMQKRAGGNSLKSKVGTAAPSPLTRLRSMVLPENFDWRNVSGVNYVSPVRDQGSCGSCYGFASMAGLEARVRILTRNEQKPVFSVQDILECSKLSQGCDGGFPYLIAGRYAQEHGVVVEECSPYKPAAAQKTCTTDPNCLRHYTAFYRYIGGYYGACNEDEIKIALVKGGPIMVGFEVYPDFMHYHKGIYHHTGLTAKFNPFEETNHAVLVVGYGVEPTTKERYWIVKNSWGESWGDGGYFRIRRGNDECGIESLASEVVPIPA